LKRGKRPTNLRIVKRNKFAPSLTQLELKMWQEISTWPSPILNGNYINYVLRWVPILGERKCLELVTRYKRYLVQAPVNEEQESQ